MSPGTSTFGKASPQTALCYHGWQTHTFPPWAPTPMEPGTCHAVCRTCVMFEPRIKPIEAYPVFLQGRGRGFCQDYTSDSNKNTLIYQWKSKRGKGWRENTIQRLNKASGLHESNVLSTWSWCKQGWPCLHHHTDLYLTRGGSSCS